LKEFEEEGYTDVLYFPLPFVLSKATENLLLIKDELNSNVKLHIYNARSTTLLLGYLANEAQKMADKGYSIEQILDRTERLRNNTVAYFVVDDLNHLVRSGRLRGVTGFIGNLMKIKPILTLSEEGAVVPYSKVRTHRRAVEEMVKIVNNEFAGAKKVAYFILHSGRPKEAQAIKEAYVDNAPNKHSFYLSTIPPILGVHVGCGLIGYGGYILDGIEEI
jgi:DegV family protein with EDD domain